MENELSKTEQPCTIHSVSGCLCDGCSVREPPLERGGIATNVSSAYAVKKATRIEL
jgi:hypothetical protein